MKNWEDPPLAKIMQLELPLQLCLGVLYALLHLADDMAVIHIGHNHFPSSAVPQMYTYGSLRTFLKPISFITSLSLRYHYHPPCLGP
jgi:hypothetical protein